MLRREGLRVLCAFVLYLALQLTGVRGPLHRAYTALVMDAATAMLPSIQHFPAVATLANVDISNLDMPVMLLICLGAVATRVPPAARLLKFGAAGLVLFAFSVGGTLAWTQVRAAEELARSSVVLYLPWEFRALDAIKYLLYDFGLEASTFGLLALSVHWNAPELAAVLLPERPPPTTGAALRRKGAIVAGAAALVIAALAIWGHVRESIPEHIRAHARLGDLFLAAGKLEQAEDQYRAAVAGDPVDPEPWLQLAALLSRRGARSEAGRVLAQGLDAVKDAGGRRKLQEALAAPLQNP